MERIIKHCVNTNETIKTYIETSKSQNSLAFHIDEQYGKSVHNREFFNRNRAQDFIDLAVFQATECYDEVVAKDIRFVLNLGTINLSDHVGGIYSPQSFQGDILYAIMLDEYDVKYIPLCPWGQISLRNSTYPRGIAVYESLEAPLKVPVIKAKYQDMIVPKVPPFGMEELKAAKDKLSSQIDDENIKAGVLKFVDDFYAKESDASDGYLMQVCRIYQRLSESVLKSKSFVSLDMTSILRELLIKDMADEDSLIYKTLYSDVLLKDLIENGLGNSFFDGVDEKGRLFKLSLNEDGKLTGHTIGGIEYSFDRNEIVNGLVSGEILPGILAACIMLVYDRGFTWYGGEFSAEYMSEWRQIYSDGLKKVLNKGLWENSDLQNDCDLQKKIDNIAVDGYLSGPVFTLCKGTPGHLVEAGPLEFLLNGVDYERCKERMSYTLYDTHVMNMYEFYNDTTVANEQEDGWYEKITEYYYEKYSNKYCDV